MTHIVIIGNGISGITAARHIRKLSNYKITVISEESDYFFSRTALMYVYMGHLKFEHTQPYENWFWKKNRIILKKGRVASVNTSKKQVLFEGSHLALTYSKLIIATGSIPKKYGCPGQDLKGVMGLYHKQDLEQLEIFAPNNKVCQRAVIVGGGLIGVELAEMLDSRQIPVTFLVRESSFWNSVLPKGESEMISRHIKNHNIDIRFSTNVKEIRGNTDGKVKSVVIQETDEKILCDFVGITTGVTPNIDFLNSNTEIETAKGVKVNHFLETSVRDVYAIGDCAEQQRAIGYRPPIEAVWYTGKIMGETIAQTICGKRTAYQPGHWFNSAKFFDIEYQTYGWVFSKPLNNNNHFFWIHPDDTKCITIEYHNKTREFKGINTFGIRMRHKVFDLWLSEKRSIDFVIENLREANFDPEFYRRYEKDITKTFKDNILN